MEEKGLPPSKLMLEHAALASSQLIQAENVGINHFKCDECDYATNSSQELKVHMGQIHHGQQKPVVTNVENCESEVVKHQEHSPDPPEADFKCPSCLNIFSTEHNLSRHIYYLEGQGVGDKGYKVKCHLCNHTTDADAVL